MTIEEAIKHYEEMAESQENNVKNYPKPNKSVKGSGREYNARIKCANEYKQLTEWLRELKMYREVLKTGIVRGCRNCKNKYYDSEDFPCNDCDNCEHWELMEDEE
jgi:hypothetical protein